MVSKRKGQVQGENPQSLLPLSRSLKWTRVCFKKNDREHREEVWDRLPYRDFVDSDEGSGSFRVGDLLSSFFIDVGLGTWVGNRGWVTRSETDSVLYDLRDDFKKVREDSSPLGSVQYCSRYTRRVSQTVNLRIEEIKGYDYVSNLYLYIHCFDTLSGLLT